jgi:hypothetical protein
MAESPDKPATTQAPTIDSENFIDTQIPAPNAPPIIIDVRSLLQPKTL